MNYLFVTTAFVLTTFTIGTAWGQMTLNRPARVPQEQGSQLVPSAKAPFAIEFPSSPSEPAQAKDIPQSTPPKVEDAKKKVHEARKPSRNPRERQDVGTGDSTAAELNRQELSRITGRGY